MDNNSQLILWNQRGLLFDKDHIMEGIIMFVNRMPKSELNWRIRKYAQSPFLKDYESFSYPISIDDLTVQQMQRYLIKTYEKMDKETLFEILPNFIKKYNFEQCCICTSIMGRQKNSLDCGHWVHYSCMRLQVNNRSKCPMCRKHVAVPRGKKHRRKQLRWISNDDE